jgi:hypothetical protein
MTFESNVPLLPAAATTTHRREAAKDNAERSSADDRCAVPVVAMLRLIKCAPASTHVVMASARRVADVVIRPSAVGLAAKMGNEINEHPGHKPDAADSREAAKMPVTKVP